MGLRAPGPRRNARGFTAVELLTVVAIVAILVGVAVPSLRDLIDRQRLKGQANELAADLHHLRSESLRRGQTLYIWTLSSAAGSCYVLHDGSKNGCSCDASGTAACSAGSTAFKTVGFAADAPVQLVYASAQTLLIEPRRGFAVTGGTFRLATASTVVNTILAGTGRVRSSTCPVATPSC